MRHLRLIQHNIASHYAVYIVDNFLESDYHKQILEKVIELTQKDSMAQQTNVKANMTKFTELLNHKLFEKMFMMSVELLQMFFTLRSPSPTNPYEYIIDEAWAMKHLKGNNTIEHIHGCEYFSCAYYPKIPGETTMSFSDFGCFETLKENSLYIFHGLTKHAVLPQQYDEPRYSIAFNILQKNIKNKL